MSKGDVSKSPRVTFDSESTTYEEVKMLAQQVSEEIPDDSPLYTYKATFNKELNLFQLTYQKNQLLLEKCDQFSASVMQTASKISSILQTAKADDQKLEKFKQEHDEVLHVIKVLHKKEIQAKEYISSLRKTLDDLTIKVNQGDVFSNGDGESPIQARNDVLKLREEIESGNEIIDDLNQKIMKITNNIELISIDTQALVEITNAMEDKLNGFLSKIKKLSIEKEALRLECKQNKDANTEKLNLRASIKEKSIKIQEKIDKMKSLKAELVKVQLDEVKKMRNKKQALMKKGKRQTEITTCNLQAKNDITRIMAQIEQEEIDIISFKQDLEQKIEMTQISQNELDQLTQYSQTIARNKHEIRKESTNLKKTITQLEQKDVRDDNESKRMNRSEQAILHDNEVLKRHLHEQKAQNMEIANQQQQLRTGKLIEKKVAQDKKIKMRNFEIEIDNKTNEMQQIYAQEHLVIDDTQVTEGKITEDTKLLDSYEDKIERQTALIEQNRDERNLFKRRWLRLLDEQNILVTNLNEQYDEYDKLKVQHRKTEKEVARTHFAAMVLISEINLLQQGNEDLSKIVIEASRSTGSIKSQIQLLNHVYDEFTHKKSLELKKIDAIKTTSEVMQHQIIERNQLIDALKYDIKNIQNQIEKGFTLYSQKNEEVDHHEKELAKFIQATMELENRIRISKSMQSDYRRYYNEYNQELQKTATMVNEIGIPRNVHRWKIYETVNPAYAQNLRYHAQITGRLDEAHKEYLELVAEKDNLIKDLKESKKKIIPKGQKLVNSFSLNLNNCRQAISDKDAEMKELDALISTTRAKICEFQEKIDCLRGKVNTKKNTATILHTKNYSFKGAIRAQTAIGERGDFFITQNPDTAAAAPQAGGGFVLRTHSTKISSKEKDESNFGSISATTPRKTVNTILRPTTSRKRPKTAMYN